jgi:hypothetical protein
MVVSREHRFKREVQDSLVRRRGAMGGLPLCVGEEDRIVPAPDGVGDGNQLRSTRGVSLKRHLLLN